MAFQMFWRKAAETDTEVTYHFGHTTELGHLLVIDKLTRQARAGDDTAGPSLGKTAGHILNRQRRAENGQRPRAGAIQS